MFYEIDTEELYISGLEFGENDNKCYIPVFKHGATASIKNLIMVGNTFFSKYYVVFDQSTLKDHNYI